MLEPALQRKTDICLLSTLYTLSAIGNGLTAIYPETKNMWLLMGPSLSFGAQIGALIRERNYSPFTRSWESFRITIGAATAISITATTVAGAASGCLPFGIGVAVVGGLYSTYMMSPRQIERILHLGDLPPPYPSPRR